MAKKFNFNEGNRAVIEISGREYSVLMTAENIAAADEIRNECRGLVTNSKGTPGKDLIFKMCEFCAGSIDRLLGAGSVAEIFEGRTVTLPDLADLLNCILDEMFVVFERASKRYITQAKKK